VILGLEPNEQAMMIDSIIGQKLSVREVESMVKKIKLPSTALHNVIEAEELDFAALKKHLYSLGYKCGTKGYKITIEFENNGQIESFLDLLS
jgi:ParB family chromosome partitioning protein